MILRCSSLPLAMRCPGSVHNDGGVLIDDWNEAGEDGTDIHRLLATHPEGDAPKELVAELSDEARILYYTGAKMWREHISAWMPNSHAEVEFADTGDSALTGHIDRLSLRLSESTAVVLDWKTGRKDYDHKAQGFGYALLVLARQHELQSVTVHFAWVRTQELESYTVTRKRADSWQQELCDIYEWDGVFHPGDHCTHCRRHATCPALHAMNKQSLALVTGQTVDLASMPSPEIATLYRRLGPLAQQISDLQEAIKSEGKTRGGIDDGAGRILHYKQTKGPREVDALKAWDALTERLTDKELAPCLKVRIGEVENAVAEKARKTEGPRKGAAAIRALNEALEKAGAIKQEPQYRWTDERKS